MALSLPNWLKKVNYRLSGSAISVMEIPPNWNYIQYLRAYGDVGWLFGANSLISEAVADVKWHLYEKDSNQLSDEVESHPLLDMWAYPNPFQTKYEFMQLTQLYLGLVGECFWVLNFNNLGTPAEMWIAPPQFMYIIPDPKTYISHYEYRRDASRLRLEVPEVIHIMSPNPFNQYRGVGASQSIAVDLDSERYAARYQQRLFYNDATPGIMIEYPDIPEKSERDKIRKEWDEIHRGWRNARKTGFLWGGAKANTLALTNRDMEFWRLRKVNREIILGAYRIPTGMMGLESPGTRAKVEAEEVVFTKFVVKPALTRIKESINEQLLPLYDDGFSFEFEDPVPENREALVAEVKELYPIGVYTLEESRTMLGKDAKAAAGESFAPPPAVPLGLSTKHESLYIKTFTDEQKEIRWRLYASKAEEDEKQFKRVFKQLWFDQMDEVLEAWENVPDIGQAFNEDGAVTGWDTALNPMIGQIFGDAYDLVTTGGALSPAHRSKQVLNQAALEWIATRSLKLATLVNGTTYKDLRAALAAGFEAGESMDDMTKRIKGYYENGYERRAVMVARTEVIAASNEGALMGYEDEGITKTEFYMSLDRPEGPPCECESYHGQIYPIEESHGIIPVHTNCRCVWIPVVD